MRFKFSPSIYSIFSCKNNSAVSILESKLRKYLRSILFYKASLSQHRHITAPAVQTAGATISSTLVSHVHLPGKPLLRVQRIFLAKILDVPVSVQVIEEAPDGVTEDTISEQRLVVVPCMPSNCITFIVLPVSAVACAAVTPSDIFTSIDSLPAVISVNATAVCMRAM
jgi:hypothetical protein